MYKILFFVVTVTGAILINLMAQGASSHPEMPNPHEQETPPNPLTQVQYRSISFAQVPHLMPDSDKPGQYGFVFPKDINPKERDFLVLTTQFQLSHERLKCFLNANMQKFVSWDDDLLPLHETFALLNKGLSTVLDPLPSAGTTESLPNTNLPSSFQKDYPLAWMVVQACETNGYLSKILDLIQSPDHTIFEHPQYDRLILNLLMAHNGLEAINKKIDNRLYIVFLNQAKENFTVLAKPANTPTEETKEKIKSTVQTMVKTGTLPSDVVQTINQYPLLKKVSDELTQLTGVLPLLHRPTRSPLPPVQDPRDEAERIMFLLERTWAEHTYLTEVSTQAINCLTILKLHPTPLEVIHKIHNITGAINLFSQSLAKQKAEQAATSTDQPADAVSSEPTDSAPPSIPPTEPAEQAIDTNPAPTADQVPESNPSESPSQEPDPA